MRNEFFIPQGRAGEASPLVCGFFHLCSRFCLFPFSVFSGEFINTFIHEFFHFYAEFRLLVGQAAELGRRITRLQESL